MFPERDLLLAKQRMNDIRQETAMLMAAKHASRPTKTFFVQMADAMRWVLTLGVKPQPYTPIDDCWTVAECKQTGQTL